MSQDHGSLAGQAAVPHPFESTSWALSKGPPSLPRWLGTSCGFCFCGRGGYRVQRFALLISIQGYASMVVLEQRKSQHRIGDREQTQRCQSRPSEAGILLESCYSRQVQCVKVCRAPAGAQSSLASMSAFASGVKLSMSRPSAARPGRRWGGTNLWLR